MISEGASRAGTESFGGGGSGRRKRRRPEVERGGGGRRKELQLAEPFLNFDLIDHFVHHKEDKQLIILIRPL